MEEKKGNPFILQICKILVLLTAVITLTCSAGGHALAATQKLSTPTITSVTNQDGSVKVKWKKVKKSTGYIVYRKKTGGSYKKIAELDGKSTVSYTDTKVKSGTIYRYKIQAVNSKKNLSSKKSKAGKTRYMKPVTIKNASASGKTVTLNWSGISSASKYEIYRKTSTSNTYKLLATVGGSTTTYVDGSTSYGRIYTYKICSRKGSYLSVGSTVTCTIPATIENVGAKYAMEADVTLTGSGDGYHAKLVIASPESAVSFGIQYDVDAPYPYTRKAFFLVENIHNNNAGGQAYWYVQQAEPGQTYRLMLTMSSKGICRIYIDGILIDSVTNVETPAQQVTLRVEGAAKHNGDNVNATFSNIKLKYGKHSTSAPWYASDMRTPAETAAIGISSEYSLFDVEKKVSVTGSLRGLPAGADWDSAYNAISGGVNFYYK